MIFTVFLLLLLAVLHAAATPLPLVPAGGAVTYSPHPHFKWQREADVTLEDTHRLQIARDEAFVEVVCDDRLEVVSRFAVQISREVASKLSMDGGGEVRRQNV